ncbi:MAG: hypothetical protein AB7O62_25580 [Pirellulales bacterium]
MTKILSRLAALALICLLNPCLGTSRADDLLDLSSKATVGQMLRVVARLEVQGGLSVQQGEKLQNLNLGVAGQLRYDERLLAMEGLQRRSVRHYEQAAAAIQIDRAKINPALREECQLVGADFDGTALTLFGPRTPLARDELDLIDFPGSTLLLDGLLPTEGVKRGASWQHTDAIWCGLLRLDAVAANDVTSRLVEVVSGKTAKVELAGHVDGAVDGVTTEIDVTGSYLYDLALRQITVFHLKIKEKRSISPIGPGLDVTANLHLEISPLPSSAALTDEALKDLPLELATAGRDLAYQSSDSNFRCLHPRSWHVMDERPEMTVLRMVDRGELVAQCNIATPPTSKSSDPPSLEKFQREVQQALGKNFGQFVQVASSTSPRGYVILHLVAVGQVSELPIEWHYYLVADRHGRQAMLAFTLEQKLAERLAETDQEIVGSLEFLPPPAKAATLPTTTK